MSRQNEVVRRAVPGWPGYEVRSDGTIWSYRKSPDGKQLQPIRRNRGYMVVKLCNGKLRRWCYLHVVMLEAFVGPAPDGMQACHEDGNPSNNRPDNLRWDTPKGNHADKKRHGTAQVGERHPRALLNADIVRRMRTMSKQGESITSIAIEFGVPYQRAYLAINRKTWKCIV